jgi:hypothetical protein
MCSKGNGSHGPKCERCPALQLLKYIAFSSKLLGVNLSSNEMHHRLSTALHHESAGVEGGLGWVQLRTSVAGVQVKFYIFNIDTEFLSNVPSL